MYCFIGDMEKAVSLIESTNSATASYHLARYCEENNMVNLFNIIASQLKL